MTVSRKRDRVYQRAFDHDECRQLRATDRKTWTVPALASRYGVSTTAIDRILSPKLNKRMQERQKAYMAKHYRAPCKGGCGTLVWTHRKTASGYCQKCLGALRTDSVRADTLRCSRCREWKPDEDFYARADAKARRGRGPTCRACSTIVRREHRQRNQEQEQATDRKRRLKKGFRVSKLIVFQPNGTGINEVGRVDAVSWSHAIEQIANREGEYIAVLESKFMRATVKPVQAFKVETTAS